MKQMKPFARGGIGHVDAKYFNLEILDKHSLTDRNSEVVSVTNLEKLEAVKIFLMVLMVL